MILTGDQLNSDSVCMPNASISPGWARRFLPALIAVGLLAGACTDDGTIDTIASSIELVE